VTYPPEEIGPDGVASRSPVRIDLSGRVVLVTGGGYGMGRASARRFARAGASVVVGDIDDARGVETVGLVREAGGEAEFLHADVGLEDEVEALVARTVELYGGLDYAHNNAGVVEVSTPVGAYPMESWDRVIRTNLTGTYLCMKYEIPRMLERGGGAIVNVASESTYKGNVADLGYTASKHGVVGLTQVAALQYARRGIRVNSVAPGNVETGIVERGRPYMDDATLRWLETAQPIGRLSTPEEIAEIVIWLCSESALLINGARIAADAGWNIT
jgi:NAD(P)-dependent dehydrogenase (short-subunit alcohol dehydrogenase family)